jgi:hypothetical protein
LILTRNAKFKRPIGSHPWGGSAWGKFHQTAASKAAIFSKCFRSSAWPQLANLNFSFRDYAGFSGENSLIWAH